MSTPSEISTELLPLAYADAEMPISGAPTIPVNGGQQCIPQHYLTYEHTYKSVCDIINDIEFDERYPLFVSQEDNALMIQVGIISYDNYKLSSHDEALHIVYGRKWRVEKNLPSAEIIQTALLALQKAKEHELRELFCLFDRVSGKYSTPFNGHHDTPLLVNTLAVVSQNTPSGLTHITRDDLPLLLSLCRFDSQALRVKQCVHIDHQRYVVDIELHRELDISNRDKILCPELQGRCLSLLIESSDANVILNQIMTQLIQLGHQHVSEHFTYRGYRRFSQYTDVFAIGAVSIATRNKIWSQNPDFSVAVKATNQAVDATRVPILSEALCSSITEQFHDIAGHKPIVAK